MVVEFQAKILHIYDFNLNGFEILTIFGLLKNNKHLIVVVGPTAVGKTAVAIALATWLETEIISADSRQFYRELSIGTAKPSPGELAQVRHYFVDSLGITEDCDAATYGRQALSLIINLFKVKDHLILCGGSGLYVKAVCEGFDDIPGVSPEVRQDLILNYERSGLSWLQTQMEALDPELYAQIDRQNPQRLIRALEVRIGTGRSINTFRNRKQVHRDFNILKLGLELPRAELYRRIEERVDQMIRQGLFTEAGDLYPYRNKNALQTVGYKEIFDYIDQKTDYDETVRLLKQNTRQYAKRQLTWFKKDPQVKWFHPDDLDAMKDLIRSQS